ncbi:YgaP-like transmembrane domain [Haloarchaeobius sp. DT45]|uniref:YgaP-like transmembrane domain n=1 Tax=Haloarchaeobius sp. DT45 TaxID=3446116 RepID=UPI003F6C0BFB
MASIGKTRGSPGNAAGRFYRWTFGVGHERNVGGVEQTTRYVLGTVLVLAALVFFSLAVLNSVSTIALGALPLLTGAFLIYEARAQYCPVNQSLGRSTYRE